MLALFDLDNTLVDRRSSLGQWANGFARSRRLRPQAASVIVDQLQERASPADFVRLRTILGLHDEPESLWCEYVDGFARSVRRFPGVLAGLTALRRAGWTLGIATNGAVDIQQAKLEATGLAPLFDGICISEGVGTRKPERRHFEAAAAACGVSLSAGGWMVGDDPNTDMAGARAAGLRTMWVANGREWADGPRAPNLVVRDAAKAIEALLEQTG